MALLNKDVSTMQKGSTHNNNMFSKDNIIKYRMEDTGLDQYFPSRNMAAMELEKGRNFPRSTGLILEDLFKPCRLINRIPLGI